MDTGTIIAAMRSPTGASAALLRVGRSGRVTLPATAPLCLEYEDVCSRPEHIEAANFGPADLAVFLDAVIHLVEPVNVWFLWRPLPLAPAAPRPRRRVGAGGSGERPRHFQPA